LLGEAVTSEAEADAYAAAYARLLEELPPIAAGWAPDPLVDDCPAPDGTAGRMPRVNVSLKLSALDSQFDALDPRGTTARVLSRLRPLWRLARARGAQVHVDMESHATKDLTLAIFQAIAMEPEFRDWPDCGIVVQCYLRDAPADLQSLAVWAAGRTRGSCGRRSAATTCGRSRMAWPWPNTSASTAASWRCRCSTGWAIPRSRPSRRRAGGCGSTCPTANSSRGWPISSVACSKIPRTIRSCERDS
ncbi:MAG: hypothetical protein EBR23_15795, partial [Planctomycetia bacterium]|nr:hypothetical protein [Planctomycetia bacterium]